MSEGLRVTRVFIKNILGIRELDFTPTDITVVGGGNRAGKTGVLKTIERGLKGGKGVVHLLRESETGEEIDHGEIGLEIESSEGPISIKETVTSDKASVEVTKGGHPVTSPREWLKTLFDPYSLNPVDYLSADGKKRQKLLLEAMPMTLQPAEIAEALDDANLTKKATEGLAPDTHALIALEFVRDWIFKDRTEVNRAVKDKRSTERDLRSSLPAAGVETDWDGELQAARRERDAMADQWNTRQSLIEEEARTTANDAKTLFEEEVERLRVAFEKGKEKARASQEAGIDAAANLRGRALEELAAEFRPRLATAEQRLGEISQARDQHLKAAGARDLLARTVVDAEKFERESERRTRALDRLDGLRERLLARLPIKNVTVSQGDVLWKGRPLDQASTTEQIGIVFQVAKLRAGPLKLMLIDRFESLDASQREAFIAAAKKMSGWQFIVTVVTEGPLYLEDV